MRVAIITNINKPRVRPAVDELVPWIKQRAELVGLEAESHLDLDKIDCDVILVLGGDGTLLSTAQAQGEGTKSGQQQPDLSGLDSALSNLGNNLGTNTGGNNGGSSPIIVVPNNP